MPQKAGVLGLAAVIAIAGVMAAEAGESRGQLVVSAYVMVSTSIATALGGSPQNQLATGQGVDTPGFSNQKAATDTGASSAFTPQSTKPTICASVAVSCSSDAPMRVNIDGAPESAVSGERCAPTLRGSRQSFGLCGTPASQSNLLAVTIEY
jgi:hypothetical protein